MPYHLEAPNEIELRLHMKMAELSNPENLDTPLSDAIVERAAEEFKAALRKQFNPEERKFKLRASNAGRPLCQLWHESHGSPAENMEYNHIVRMLMGDASEVLANVLIAEAGINVTGAKQRVSFQVGETIINGENDVEIDGKVFDVKSCSAWAFDNKWNNGWEGVYFGDTFGYVTQLYIYAEGNPDRMGGWIVINKSTGEVRVVEARPTEEQLREIRIKLAKTERMVSNPALLLERQFEPEDETYYKKPTGNKVLPTICQMCQYLKPCWPEAVQKPKALSKAANPHLVWYTEYKEQDNGISDIPTNPS